MIGGGELDYLITFKEKTTNMHTAPNVKSTKIKKTERMK